MLPQVHPVGRRHSTRTESAKAMRGLEGHVVLNCTEKPKSADYKKLGLNGTNASRNLRFEVEEEKVRVGGHTMVPRSSDSGIVAA